MSQTVEEIEADAVWWESVGKVMGYQLNGWTMRHTASFIRDDKRNTIIQLTAHDARMLLKYAPNDGET